MRSDDIFEAMTDISDSHINARPAARRIWLRFAAAAAALCLIIAAAVPLYGRLGGSAGNSGGGATAGSDGASVFMSYAGPALPLTAVGGGLTAVRTLTWDFSPWEKVWCSIDDMLAELSPGLSEAELADARAQHEEWFPEGGYWASDTDVLITDEYALSGPAGNYTLAYPFVSSFRDLSEYYNPEAGALIPSISVDGVPAEGRLVPGGGADYPDSFDDYRALLEGGGYLDAALAGVPDLTQVPAVVYRLDIISAPEKNDSAPNPTVEVSFRTAADTENVFTYGFSGGSFDQDGGVNTRNDSIYRGAGDGDVPRFLIVTGGDIELLGTAVYTDGSCEPGKKAAGEVCVSREETTLDAALREAFDDFDVQYYDGADNALLYGALCSEIVSSGVSYTGGDAAIESLINETAAADRVFYLVFDIALPEGGAAVTASMRKEASFDFHCADTDNRGVYGYDLAVRLGSSIEMSSMSARLENPQLIEIVRQNCGFDPGAGVTEVQLDPAGGHYYIEVRAAR